MTDIGGEVIQVLEVRAGQDQNAPGIVWPPLGRDTGQCQRCLGHDVGFGIQVVVLVPHQSTERTVVTDRFVTPSSHKDTLSQIHSVPRGRCHTAGVDFDELTEMARGVRAKYAAMETARYGRSWSREEIMLGFLGDVGDLAKLVQGKEGVRPRGDLDDAFAHELADCLWCVVTLADSYGVDLQSAFVSTMAELNGVLDED